MKNQIKDQITSIQDEYHNLLSEYKYLTSKNNLSLMEIAGFIDEIEIFWLKELEIIRYGIKYLTNNFQCLLLSGELNLEFKSNEHFYFKTFGDYHIISDPILKMECFFRTNEKNINMEIIINNLINTYKNTFMLLENFKDNFFILPIGKLYWKNNKENNLNLMDSFFWKFISEIFNEKLDNTKAFCCNHKSFDEIEEELDQFVLNNLIYIDSNDSHLKLKERAERYQNSNSQFSILTKNMSEPEIFIFMTKNYFSQVIDILLSYTSTGLIPYISFEVTFRYMILIIDAFLQDQEFKEMFRITTISYIFYRSIDANVFKNIDFNKYCYQLKEKNLLGKILSEIDDLRIDILNCDLEVIVKIIENKFSDFLKSIIEI